MYNIMSETDRLNINVILHLLHFLASPLTAMNELYDKAMPPNDIALHLRWDLHGGTWDRG